MVLSEAMRSMQRNYCILSKTLGVIDLKFTIFIPVKTRIFKQIVDFNQFPWPFADNEFDHIVAKDILEHLGDTSSDFIKAIKEMYRISHNGAIWEVQSPHWRCDTALDDPDHKRLITMGMFNLFNKRMLLEKLQNDQSDSALAFEHDIDIEICDMQFDYTEPWQDKLRKREIGQDELNYALSGVISEMKSRNSGKLNLLPRFLRPD